MKLKSIALTLCSFCIAVFSGTKAAEAGSLSLIADGLDNARGVSVSPDGSVWVTETGVGGDGGCVQSPSVQFAPLCSGTTASITRVRNGVQERVFTELPSLAIQPSGIEAAGPQDIKFDSQGNAYLVYGFAGDPATRESVFNEPVFAKLYEFDLNTGEFTRTLADLGSYELANNPDGGDVISNPYALAIKDDTAYIADAGANTLLSVALDGSGITGVTPFSSRPFAVGPNDFPPPDPNAPLPPGFENGPPSEINLQPVPTGVAIGPDGAVYVTDLSGFPYPEGGSRIYRIGEDGEPTVYADGFTMLADLEFDQDGNLLALQYADRPQWTGELAASLFQIAPDGTRTTLVDGGFESATSIGLGPDGAIYVTDKGDRPAEGRVWLVSREEGTKRVPEPTSVITLLVVGAFGGMAMLKRKHYERLLSKVEIS